LKELGPVRSLFIYDAYDIVIGDPIVKVSRVDFYNLMSLGEHLSCHFVDVSNDIVPNQFPKVL
jgi:hypothetical protein